MLNKLDDYIYFNPGDIVIVKHNIDNKPKMLVVEKATKALWSKKDGEKNNVFLGIKCIWFDNTGRLQEHTFSTKDLIHVNND